MALPEFQRGYVWNRNQVQGAVQFPLQSASRRRPAGLGHGIRVCHPTQHLRHSPRLNGTRMRRKASDLGFMSSSLHKIEEQARLLSAEDRAKLAERMLESLHTPLKEIEAAWSEEIAFRIQAFADGDISAVSAEQLFAEARQILK